MKILIQKGIPAPRKVSRTSKYPFSDMEVGDSFFIKHEDPEFMRKRLSAAACMFCNKNEGFKFKTQVFDSGVRIWRIS